MQINLTSIRTKYGLHPDFIGVEIDSVNQVGASGDTLLHIAARKRDSTSVKFLIDNGAAVDAIGDEQNTPLHYAAATDDVAIVKMLVEHGARVNARNSFEHTASDIASIYNFKDVVDYLTTVRDGTSLHQAR